VLQQTKISFLLKPIRIIKPYRFVFLLLIAKIGFAQNPFNQNTFQNSQQNQFTFTDTSTGWQPFKVREVKYYIGEDELNQYTVDTSLQNFQVYDPALQANFNYRTIGSVGLAAYTVFFQPNNKFGFDLGYNSYNLYRLNRHNMRHYKSPEPFTEFNLMIGRKREQLVNVYHAQTIKNRFDFSFEYNRAAGKGFYKRQLSNNNNFGVSLAYKTKKQRYKIGGIFIFSNVNPQENGGLLTDNILYKDTLITNKELLGVNLNDAQTSIKDREVLLKQEVAFGKMITQKINDTISVKELAPVFKIYHQAGYLRTKINYNDNTPDSTYYGMFFPEEDTLIPKDTLANYLFLQKISNKGGVILQFVDKYDSTQISYKNFVLDASIEHDIFYLKYDVNNTTLQNLNLVGILSNHPLSDKRLLYMAKAAFSFIGYNSGDLILEAKLGYRFKKAGIIEGVSSLQRREPGWFFQHYAIRDLAWNNNFNKVMQYQFGFDYALAKYRVLLSGRLYNITNLLYSDQQKLPQQYSGNTQAWIVSLMKNFRWKGLGLDNLVRLQYISGSDFIRMPKVWLRHSVYFEGKLFKDALQSRIGVDMTYNTNYFANGYFPLTGQFYVQDIQMTKFYPVFDVWASFKIKTFRIFLKMDHLNPGVQRSFRIGISWRFYD
jgi:hypothetical protein